MRDYGQAPYQVSRRKRTSSVQMPKAEFNFDFEKARKWLKILVILGAIFFLLKWGLSWMGTQEFLKPIEYEFEVDKKDEQVALVEDVPMSNVDELKRKVDRLTSGKQGTYGWYVQSLVTGSTYGEYADQVFTAASVNKVPIVLAFLKEAEKGHVDLDDVYVLSNADKEDGTGSLQYQEAGEEYTYRELIELIGKESDNTALNAIVVKLGKPVIQDYMEEWGMAKTSLEQNQSSPQDMGNLFGLLYHDRIVRQEYRDFFLNTITDTDFEDRIPAGVPNGVVVAHKIGNQIQVLNDCGIVMAEMPYSICMMTEGIRESEAQVILPEISRFVWDWENRL